MNYYIVINNQENKASIYTTKKNTAKACSISVATITRRLTNSDYFSKHIFTVYRVDGIIKGRSGIGNSSSMF